MFLSLNFDKEYLLALKREKLFLLSYVIIDQVIMKNDSHASKLDSFRIDLKSYFNTMSTLAFISHWDECFLFFIFNGFILGFCNLTVLDRESRPIEGQRLDIGLI
jgi:hypothetical protein